MAHLSESLRAVVSRYKAHNDRVSPPASPAERIRGHLREARTSLDRVERITNTDAIVAGLHSAVASMLAAMETT